MEEPNYKRTSYIPNDQDEQTLRENLIQCAQTRLRYLQLEENLRQVLETVVSMQTKLETLRVDTATTLDTVANIFDGSKSPEITQKMNRQMDVLERRLESHKLSLETLHLPEEEPVVVESSDSLSFTMSRLSSLSSIFGRHSISSCPTSIDDAYLKDDDEISQIESVSNPHFDEDHPFYDLAGKRSFGAGSFCGSVYSDSDQPVMALPHDDVSFRSKRRQRRQRHQQYLQQQHLDEDIQHPLSPHSFVDQWYHQNDHDQRNVLDEAMSFLDGLSEDGDDGGFGEDMYLLLRNPELCCKPLDETTLKKLRQKEHGIMLKDVIHLLKPTTWIQLAVKYSCMMVYRITCTGLDWCRFLSILAAAVMISILKGPDDMKR